MWMKIETRLTEREFQTLFGEKGVPRDGQMNVYVNGIQSGLRVFSLEHERSVMGGSGEWHFTGELLINTLTREPNMSLRKE